MCAAGFRDNTEYDLSTAARRKRRKTMKIAKESWNWIREPAEYRIEENRIEIVTKPHTELWQRSYNQLRNDNAPVLQLAPERK